MYASDHVLIRGCLKGNENAWKMLVHRYGRLVYSLARRCGLSAQDSDEVFQNVFSIVLRKLPRLRDHRLFAAWLITIARRESQRYSKRRKMTVELDESILDETADPFEHAVAEDTDRMVHQAIGQLEPRYRNLVSQLYLASDEPNYREIARRLGIPLGSIGPSRARCIKKLELILERMDAELSRKTKGAFYENRNGNCD